MRKYLGIDLKDRKILFELDKNARISFAKLGKKVGLSTEVVNYRVKRLEESGIITSYQTSVDYEKLCLIHFKICLLFNGISISTEEGVYLSLKTIPQVVWIAKCQGDFDCIISCTVDNMSELNRIKDEVISVVNSYITKKEISISFEIKSFARNYLIGKREETLPKASKIIKIDETDLKILRIILDNARNPIIDIASRIGLSVKATAVRIKKLQKSGVIINFRLVINYDKLGIYFYKTFLYLKNPDKKRVRLLLKKLNTNPNLIHNLRVIAEWDLEPEFEFEKKEDFQRTIQDLMNEFSDIIQRISVVTIIKEYKYTFFYK